MKKIGIIFAMEEELKEFLNIVELKNSYEIFGLTFYECSYNSYDLVLVESGIGKVNSARCTQVLIDNMKVDYIFNAGVAGSVSTNVNIGDIVIADKLVQHDFDLTSFNREKGDIPNVGIYIPCDEYLVRLASEISDVNKHIGTIASGDIFITEEKMSKKINTKFNALAVEMEGASIAQVCYLSHIPFLVIRSISDSPNNNNVIDYEEFMISSSKVVANFMKELLNKEL